MTRFLPYRTSCALVCMAWLTTPSSTRGEVIQHVPDGRTQPIRQTAGDLRDGNGPGRAPRVHGTSSFAEHPRIQHRSTNRRLVARRPRRSPRRFDLRPQFIRDGSSYRFGVPAFAELDAEQHEEAYRRGLRDGRDAQRSESQSQRGLAAYDDAMAAGHAAFTTGDYGLAARQFLLAATLNQGDPSSRLCAAHAHVALGAYDPAARLLRRAFALQPKLVYLPLDLRNAYGNRDDFDRHVEALRAALGRDAEMSQGWFLLGYVYYYSNALPEAAKALALALRDHPDDELVARLAGLAQLSSPQVPARLAPRE